MSGRSTSRAGRPAGTVEAAPTRGGRSLWPLFCFCAGALAAKLVGAVLPPLFSSTFDIAIYAGIALSGALAYRRFVRRAIEDRRRLQARRARTDSADAP